MGADRDTVERARDQRVAALDAKQVVLFEDHPSRETKPGEQPITDVLAAQKDARVRIAQGPQLIEVTRDKKVVWILQDWKHVGDGTAVQILDDPGIPEIPGESEH